MPAARRRYLELMPEHLEVMRADSNQLAAQLNSSPRAVEEGLARLEFELSQPDVMTSEIARNQWTSEELTDVLVGMNWTVLVARGLDRFVTADNPGFFVWKDGLRALGAQLALPLSSTAALVADWHKSRDVLINHIEATEVDPEFRTGG